MTITPGEPAGVGALYPYPVKVLGTDGKMHDVYPANILPEHIDSEGRLIVEPKRWPLKLGGQVFIDMDTLGLTVRMEDRYGNCMSEIITHQNMDRLLVALCQERGINLELCANSGGDAGFSSNKAAIRVVLDNANRNS